MFRSPALRPLAVAALIALACRAHADVIGHAAEVIAYAQGTPPSSFAAYDDPAAALGVSPTDTGTFGGMTFHVTPFNNPWSNADSVTLGAGGHLTLRLDRYAMPIDGPELGVFVMQQFLQTAGGGTDAGPTAFYDAQFAIVEVSDNGSDWIALDGGSLIAFDIPSNAFNDVDATDPADYHLPFPGDVSLLANKASFADVLAAYGGSAGGTWLDLSATGLDRVGFVRFTVPDDATFSLQLEALSIATGAIGSPVPEPAAAVVVTLSLVALGRRTRRAGGAQ